MTVLIITESYFGNTLTVTRAIAAGIAQVTGPEAVTVARPGEAPLEIPGDVGLLLVGAPTHNMTMPGAGTRAQATAKGATGGDGTGVREWIARVSPRPGLRVVAFDTSVKGFMSGSAAKAAAKALRNRGFRAAERGPSFTVTGVAGPLADGERERATAWGVQLGDALRGETVP